MGNLALKINLQTWSVMFLRRELLALAETGDAAAAALLPRIQFETSLTSDELEYLCAKVAAAAEKEGNAVGPAIRVLAELSDLPSTATGSDSA